MNSRWVLRVTFTALGVGLASGITWGQEREPAPVKGGPALEKRVGELERQLSSLVKELQDLRWELRLNPKPSVIPVKEVDPTDFASIVRQIYSDSPGVRIEALPKMISVAVQADAKTTQEIRALLSRLEQAAREEARGPLTVIAGSISTDPKLLEEAIRAIKKAQEATLKDERAKREGAWVMVSWVENGVTIPSDEARKWKMVIKGDEAIVTRDGTEILRGRIRIDVTSHPYREDFTMTGKGGTATMYLGICSLKDNRLACCYAERSRGRPAEFNNGPDRALVVWQRALSP